MTPIEKLKDVLFDLQNVLKAIRNEPEGVVLGNALPYLNSAIEDSLISLKLAMTDLDDFAKYQGKTENQILRIIKPKGKPSDAEKEEASKIFKEIAEIERTLFDTGLLNNAQLDFKYSVYKKTYNDLAPFLIIPIGDNMTDDLRSLYMKYYEEKFSSINEDNSTSDKNLFHRFTEYAKKGFKHIPKLKPFLSSAKTIISSLFKMTPQLEKVCELLGMLGVSLNLTEPVVNYFDDNKLSEK